MLSLLAEDKISDDDYKMMREEIDNDLLNQEAKLDEVRERMAEKGNLNSRIETFKKFLTNRDNDNLAFDPVLFKALIKTIVIGNSESGDPIEISMIYKTGFEQKAYVNNWYMKPKAGSHNHLRLQNVADAGTTHVECVALIERKVQYMV